MSENIITFKIIEKIIKNKNFYDTHKEVLNMTFNKIVLLILTIITAAMTTVLVACSDGGNDKNGTSPKNSSSQKTNASNTSYGGDSSGMIELPPDIFD